MLQRICCSSNILYTTIDILEGFVRSGKSHEYAKYAYLRNKEEGSNV